MKKGDQQACPSASLAHQTPASHTNALPASAAPPDAWRRSQRAPEMTSFTVASILEKTTSRRAHHACTRREDATRPVAQSQRPGPPRSSAAFLRLSLASRCSAPRPPCAGTRTFATWPRPTCSPSSPRRPSSRTQTASARSASACSSCSTTSRLMCRAWPSSGACPSPASQPRRIALASSASLTAVRPAAAQPFAARAQGARAAGGGDHGAAGDAGACRVTSACARPTCELALRVRTVHCAVRCRCSPGRRSSATSARSA